MRKRQGLQQLVASHYFWVAQLNAGCFSESHKSHLIFSIANWSREVARGKSWGHDYAYCAYCGNKILFLWKLLASHYFWVAQLNAGCFSESHVSHLTASIAIRSREFVRGKSLGQGTRALQQQTLIFVKTASFSLFLSGTVGCGLFFWITCVSLDVFHSELKPE